MYIVGFSQAYAQRVRGGCYIENVDLLGKRVMNPLVSASELGVSFDGQTLVSPTSFHVDEGEALAVLGPNGAGKTTLLRLVSGRLRPSTGTITVCGMAPNEKSPKFRAAVAALLGSPPTASNLTVREHLTLVAASWNAGADVAAARSEFLLEQFGITRLALRYPHELSTGQSQLFALALTLSRSFDVLLLDEPEQRLDAQRVHLVGQILRSLVLHGKTIIMASHNADLVDQVCDRQLEVREVASDNLT